MVSANLVKQKAKEIGFDLVGITSVRPMDELAQLLETRQKEGLQSKFISASIQERLDPRCFFPEGKAVIMVGLNYYYPTPNKAFLTGKLARIAWGLDYHRVLGEMLVQLGQSLEAVAPGLQYRTFVDTGPLLERELARRAGLGWIGKNAVLITPEFGSWVVLGGMVINRELVADIPLDRDCGTCQQCLKACPSGAIEEAYRINPHRCLSYLTQKKGYLALSVRRVLGSRLYGCDTCQEVCPVNRERASIASTSAFHLRGHEILPLEVIVRLSNKEFRELFGSTAAAWRGKTNLKRNAIIALGNSGASGAIPFLIEALNDPSPLFRSHAAWALGRYEDDHVLHALGKALAKEKDAQVRKEIFMALGQ